MAYKTRLIIYLYNPLLLIISLLITSNCYSAPQPAFVKGTIHSAYNNSLIPGATITSTTGVSTYTTAGTFSLRVPPDIYNIFFSAPGYKSNFLSGTSAHPGQTTNIDIFLSPASTELGYVRGKISSLTTGNPIKNAYVMSSLGGFAVTDEDGLFLLSTPSGLNNITVSAEDFKSEISNDNLISPTVTTDINLRLQPVKNDEIIIIGTITDQCTGTIISDADIICLNGKVDSPKDGTFTIKAPSGTTTIIVTAEGYQYAYKSIDTLPMSISNMVDFTLTPNENDFGQVKGIITDSITGELIDSAELTTDTGETSYSKTTGEYKIFSSICSSTIITSKIGYSENIIPVSFLSGILVTIDISLDPQGKITGEITDSYDGHKIEGTKISLDDTNHSSIISDADGTYTLENIVPGTYTLSTSHGCYSQSTTQITVNTGDQIKNDFILSPTSTGTVNGYVYDKFSREPLTGVAVKADHGTLAKTDISGYYSIILPAECSTNITYKADDYISSTYYDLEIDSVTPKQVDIYLTYCPVLLSLSGNNTDNSNLSMYEVFRNNRDLILTHNSPLKKHVLSYYKNAFEISSILIKNPKLLNLSKKILYRAYDLLIKKGTTEKIIIPANFVNETTDFINSLIKKSTSRTCKNDLESLIVDLKNTSVLQSIF